ncbi:MAG TPA: pyruvate formate lyase 1-activating protein, partial [Sphaerochaetaceae bacterium]|nr:pyruvate formate lyase 1-activating protein [Sphaerochaetaceae bacterium]
STLDYLEQIGKRVWLRHVLVPGWTLQHEQLSRLAAHLAPYHCVEQVELLPFHKMGEFKWKELGLHYSLLKTPEPSVESLREAQEIFEKHGLNVLLRAEDSADTKKIG